MITIMGATGRVGGQITTLLSQQGVPVRAIGRSGTKLAELARTGIETRTGDATDVKFLANAFRDADACFTLLPYDPFLPNYFDAQNRLGEAIVAALQATDVQYIVFLSSIGADLSTGTGFIASLHDQEQRLRALEDRNVLALRPGSFFENFYEMLPVAREQGVIAETVAPDVSMPMVATADIARVAADALATRDWNGFVVREVTGQRDLSYREATRIIGQTIGKPELSYVQLPDDEMIQALTELGFSDDAARLHVELNQALNSGIVRPIEGNGSAITAATTFEAFAADLATVYQAL